MKNILLIFLLLLTSMQALNKLDELDKESQKFLKAIIGLENDYLQNKAINFKENQQEKKKEYSPPEKVYQEKKISKEQLEKNVFTKEANLARLTSDFARSINLIHIKIKSMYTFNQIRYVVLSNSKKSEGDKIQEQSFNIEGRYIVGDNIFSHKIIKINTRNKNIKLFKKIDKDYYYTISLSNNNISISPLQKYKTKTVKRKVLPRKKSVVKKKIKTKKITAQKNISKKTIQKGALSCRYKIKANMINVREKRSLNSRIVKLLKRNDIFSISEKLGTWYHLHTIYRTKGQTQHNVQKEDIWVKLAKNSSLIFQNKCF